MKKRLFLLLLILIPSLTSAKEVKEENFTYGGSGWDHFYDGSTASDGGFIAVGPIRSTDIEGITNKGSDDAIAVKYDWDGKIEWQKSYGGNNSDIFWGVTTTLDGGFVTVGYTYSTDIEGITNKDSDKAIIVKYDKNGNVEWQKSYDDNNSADFKNIIATLDGGFVVVGCTYSTDFEVKGSYDALLVKYDKDGNIEQQRTYGGSKSDYFSSVIETSDGGYVAVGETNSTDIGITNDDYHDALIVKFDKDLNVEYEKGYGGQYYDSFLDVIETEDGNYIAVGELNTKIANAASDAIIVEFDKKLNIKSEKRIVGRTAGDYRDFRSISPLSEGYVTVGNSDDGPIIYKLSTIYDITNDETENGTYDAVQEGNKGKITINPEEGYELDQIIIKDSEGNVIEYYNKNGFYYFDITDDVTIEVSFKEKIQEESKEETKNDQKEEEITNPSTGVLTPYMGLTITILIIALILCLTRKKKYI